MRRALGLVLVALLVAAPASAVELRLDPDRHLTPGDTVPCTLADLCTPGYTKRVRQVTAATKLAVWKRYGYDGPQPGQWEIDHFIPLELCGSNDLLNLWPEPVDPRPGANEKDWVEQMLHRLVCTRPVPLLSLAVAQDRMRSWLAIWTILHTPEPEFPGAGGFGRMRP